MLQCVNGRPSAAGRVVVVSMINAMSSALIRQAGTASRPFSVRQASPHSLKARITHLGWRLHPRRQPYDRRPGVPDAGAMMIIALRTRIDSCFPRRAICCSR
jgi:hypothetical protein